MRALRSWVLVLLCAAALGGARAALDRVSLAVSDTAWQSHVVRRKKGDPTARRAAAALRRPPRSRAVRGGPHWAASRQQLLRETWPPAEFAAAMGSIYRLTRKYCDHRLNWVQDGQSDPFCGRRGG